MIKTAYTLILFFVCCFASGQKVPLENEDFANLLSAQLGAKVHSFCDHDSLHKAHNVIDDDLGHSAIWRMRHHKTQPTHWLVIELHKTKVLTTFAFNTGGLDEDKCLGITANYVSILLSNESGEKGFKEVGNVRLKKNKNAQIVTIEAQEARWVKFLIENNDGCPHFTEIGRIYAYNDVELHEYEEMLDKIGYIDIQDILFETSSARLNRVESMPHIEVIAGIMKERPDLKLVVEGNTDDLGSAEFNKTLSVKRAETVYKELISLGIAPERLRYMGHGSRHPLELNHNEEGRARNRRVTFRVSK